MNRLGLLLALATTLCAQSPAPPEFEVASVKLDPAAEGPPGMRVEHNGHMAAHRMSLEMLISAAYDVEYYQITKGPDWVRTERYDVSAVTGAGLSTESFDWWKPLLRSLLADRFRLVLHRETKQMPVYDLATAKGGILITPAREGSCIAADPQNPPQPRPGEAAPRLCNRLHFSNASFEASGVTMQVFANALAGMLNRSVINKTGFTGMFDLHFDYAPLDATDSSSAAPSLFTVLQDQLGLKLEPAKGPVEIFVIDHAERPTTN